MATLTVTPADLRAELARRRIALYRLAPFVHLHPGRLGGMLNERIPLPHDVAERIMRVLSDEDLGSAGGEKQLSVETRAGGK